MPCLSCQAGLLRADEVVALSGLRQQRHCTGHSGSYRCFGAAGGAAARDMRAHELSRLWGQAQDGLLCSGSRTDVHAAHTASRCMAPAGAQTNGWACTPDEAPGNRAHAQGCSEGEAGVELSHEHCPPPSQQPQLGSLVQHSLAVRLPACTISKTSECTVWSLFWRQHSLAVHLPAGERPKVVSPSVRALW